MVLCIHARVRVVERIDNLAGSICVLVFPYNPGKVFVEAIDTVVFSCHIDISIRCNYRLIEVVVCHRQRFYQYGPGLQIE